MEWKAEAVEMMDAAEAVVLVCVSAKGDDGEARCVALRNPDRESAISLDETITSSFFAIASACVQSIGLKETLQCLKEVVERASEEAESTAIH